MEKSKTRNIFDYLQTDPESLDETTIYEETGVKPENVRRIFMDKIKNNNIAASKTKKTGKKKVFFVLAAAIAATLALGTVGAGAAGSFNTIFGEQFAGEKMNGVYGGGNVHVTTSDGFKTDFLGISGDHHNVMAAINITKTDGSSFVTSEDVKYTYIFPTLFGMVYNEDTAVLEKQFSEKLALNDTEELPESGVQVSRSLWNQITNGNQSANNATQNREYVTVDDHTLKCIMYYQDPQYELVGETMSVNEPVIYIYNVKRDVLECDMIDGYDAIYLMTETDHPDDSKKTPEAIAIAEKLTEARKTLKDNEYLVVNADKFTFEGKISFSVVEIDAEKINLSGSWKLNYKAENIRKLQIKENEFALSGTAVGHDLSDVKITVNSLDADTFSAGVTLSFKGNIRAFDTTEEQYDMEVNRWEEAFRLQFCGNISITLENGETVDGLFSVDAMTYDQNGGNCTGHIIYIRNDHSVSVPVNEITAITINGTNLIG